MFNRNVRLPAAFAFAASALLIAPVASAAEQRHENFFASVILDGSKIGQIHYTATFGPDGDVEELRTKVSVSVLGIKVYSFKQDLHEVWRDGEIQSLIGDTNDDGADYKSRVKRLSDGLDGELNDKPVHLPSNAFPDSMWHYQITEQTLLFNSVDLDLKKVSVTRGTETLEIHGKKIPTERFTFTGDWNATLWYDNDKMIVKAKLKQSGHDVEIVLDQQ